MTNKAGVIYRQDYEVPAYLISSTDLDFVLNEDFVLVKAKLQIKRNSCAKNAQDLPKLSLNGEHLELLELKLDGQICCNYELTKTHLNLQPLQAEFTLETSVKIYPHLNTALEGLYKSGAMFCTQCEAEGFRRITYFLDRPDVMSEFKVRITADKNKYPKLLSNGNLIDHTENEQTHCVSWHDPFPKPCYLFALVAGNLSCLEDEFITMSGRKITLQIFAKKEDLSQTEHAMTSLKKAMRWDEEVYGREYDLDLFMIVAVADFNSGAMENKGLNIFNTACVLADKDVATDAAFLRVESVVAHEYFHNWSGNRVTCRDWFQLSLKEGFTVFRDSEFSGDMNSASVKRIEDAAFLRSNQFAEDASPLAHAVRPDSYQQIRNFYTLTVYEKGAEVVRMLRTILGGDNFRKGCDLYFARHDGSAATCDDFVQAMMDASGIDLTQFMRWYSQVGTPQVKVLEQYDKDKKTYELTFEQSGEPLAIPIKIKLFTFEDNNFAQEQTLLLNQNQQTFSFSNMAHKPIASMLRDFSAPIKLDFKREQDELFTLLACETDGFAQFDAASRLLFDEFKKAMQQIEANQKFNLNPKLTHALQRVLLNEADLALKAQIIAMPNLDWLFNQIEQVNVEVFLSAYKLLQRELAQALQDDLLQIYQQLWAISKETKYEPTSTHIARRSLQNVALHYLAQLDEPQYLELAYEQYYASDNLTDRAAATGVLLNSVQVNASLGAEVLADFAQRFSNEPLAMDYWFSAQARCELPQTLRQVQNLLKHPKFSLKNPNKVRALIGAFSRNLFAFHALNGEGYKFVAEQIMAIDELNPQIAARLVASFSNWRKFDFERQNMMIEQLKRMQTKENLSNDVFEQITRIL